MGPPTGSAMLLASGANPPTHAAEEQRRYHLSSSGGGVISPRSPPAPSLPMLGRETMNCIVDRDEERGRSQRMRRYSGRGPAPATLSPLQKLRAAQDDARAERLRSDAVLSDLAMRAEQQAARRRMERMGERVEAERGTMSRTQQSSRQQRVEGERERRRLDANAQRRKAGEEMRRRELLQRKNDEREAQRDEVDMRDQSRRDAACRKLDEERERAAADLTRLKDDYVMQLSRKQLRQREERERLDREVRARRDRERRDAERERAMDVAEAACAARAGDVADSCARARRRIAKDVERSVQGQIVERSRQVRREREMEAVAGREPMSPNVPGGRLEVRGETSSSCAMRAIPRRDSGAAGDRLAHTVPQKYTDHRGRVQYRWGITL